MAGGKRLETLLVICPLLLQFLLVGKCDNNYSYCTAEGVASVCPATSIPISNDDLVMYGYMVDAAYMTFAAAKRDDDYDGILSSLLADLAAEPESGGARYIATAHLYATAKPVPRLLDALPVLRGLDVPYWFGYVAVARRPEFWDIVVAWRGSATVADWMMNIHADLESFDGGAAGQVEVGFHRVYTSNDITQKRGNLTAQKQVVREVQRLVGFCLQQQQQQRLGVRVTVVGHSLGGALALMAAHDAAVALQGNKQYDVAGVDVRLRAVTFGAPRVGDRAFHDALRARGVEVVRVVVKQDPVPHLPLGSRYVDVGDYDVTLDDDVTAPLRPHNLDMYMHLLSLRGKRILSTFTVHAHDHQEPSRPAKPNASWLQFDEEDDGYRRVTLEALQCWNWATNTAAPAASSS